MGDASHAKVVVPDKEFADIARLFEVEASDKKRLEALRWVINDALSADGNVQPAKRKARGAVACDLTLLSGAIKRLITLLNKMQMQPDASAAVAGGYLQQALGEPELKKTLDRWRRERRRTDEELPVEIDELVGACRLDEMEIVIKRALWLATDSRFKISGGRSPERRAPGTGI
jgi:hypothetical protein